MFLGTLGESSFRNLLTGKKKNRARKGINKAREEFLRASYDRPSSSALHSCSSKMGF